MPKSPISRQPAPTPSPAIVETSPNLRRVLEFIQTPDEKASLILSVGAAAWKYFSYWEHIDFLLSIREEKFSVMFDFMQNAGWAILLIIGIVWYIISLVSKSKEHNTSSSILRLVASCSVVAFLFGVIVTIRASGAVPTVLAGWGGGPTGCTGNLVTNRLMSFRDEYKIALICGIVDPTIDILDDGRIITSNLFNINGGGIAIVANNVHQPDAMKKLIGAQVQMWYMVVLLPDSMSIDKVQTLGDVNKLGGKIINPFYWQ